MGAKFDTWRQKIRLGLLWLWQKIRLGLLWLWQKIKQHPFITTGIIVVLIAFAVLVHIFGWDWTGLVAFTSPTISPTKQYQRGKTLWDVLQLIIIPIALAIIAIYFSRSERKNEQRIASDNQQEAALIEYIKEMSVLLLERDLLKSDKFAAVRTIARVRTLTLLPRLDSKRKKSVLQFLYESHLIDASHIIGGGKTIIELQGADLTGADLEGAELIGVDLYKANLKGAILTDAFLGGADLSGANLVGAKLIGVSLDEAKLIETNLVGADLERVILEGGANLTRADLTGANLRKAHLLGANLTEAYLSYADLRYADLRYADLSYTNLCGAIVTPEQLDATESLKGATMPNGTKYP